MSDVERLRAVVERLEAAYEVNRARLAKDCRDREQFVGVIFEPEEMADDNGRPILLDALTAIVNARAVLARLGSADA